MQYFIQKVREFNLKYGYPAPTTPTPTSEQQTKLRAKLIAEEVRELNEAWNTEPQDMKHIMKELCDVFYVLAGFYVENGNDAGDIVSRIMIEGNSTKSVNQNKALSLMVDFSVAMNGGHISIYNSVLEIEFNASLFASSIANRETIYKCFDAVHASNMSKGTNGVPVYNEHGKLLKGEDYKEADLSFIDL